MYKETDQGMGFLAAGFGAIQGQGWGMREISLDKLSIQG